MAKTAQAPMAMDNLYPLADTDVTQDRKTREDGGERRLTVDDKKGDVVDFEAIGEVADAFAVIVGVGDDDDLVAAVDELAGELVDVGFDAAGLGEEEVADHGDVVGATGMGWMRHAGGYGGGVE